MLCNERQENHPTIVIVNDAAEEKNISITKINIQKEITIFKDNILKLRLLDLFVFLHFIKFIFSLAKREERNLFIFMVGGEDYHLVFPNSSVRQ